MSAAPGALLRVMILGNVGAGKSSVVVRYADGEWDSCIPTGFRDNIIELRRSSEVVRLHLCDVPGQCRFVGIVRGMSRHADAAVVVYDVTDRSSFDSIPDWVSLMPGAPVMILANKVDMMARRVVSAEEGRRMAERFGATHAEVSAKCGDGVNGAFESIVSAVLPRVLERRRRRASAGAGSSRSTTSPSPLPRDVHPQSLLSRFTNMLRRRSAPAASASRA
eukprot:TRINITY_DN462_c0_g2_i1.p1 TRINITY_DN462_c0_g2~~TRINITY_DN462_c0_g2_i1.p1  ORF type:complete len:245 (+),score=69.79 TRINITY_DN462_c0_g2_i1:74-736(+)